MAINFVTESKMRNNTTTPLKIRAVQGFFFDTKGF
jgi:hypothetical protein